MLKLILLLALALTAGCADTYYEATLLVDDGSECPPPVGDRDFEHRKLVPAHTLCWYPRDQDFFYCEGAPDRARLIEVMAESHWMNGGYSGTSARPMDVGASVCEGGDVLDAWSFEGDVECPTTPPRTERGLGPLAATDSLPARTGCVYSWWDVAEEDRFLREW